MAKRNRRNARSSRGAYVHHYRRPVRRSSSVVASLSPLRLRPLSLLPLADGRLFYPDIKLHRPFAAAPRAAARLVIGDRFNSVRFASPRGVIVCVRRKLRREVLFALGVGGQSGAKARPRFTAASAVSC